MPKAPRHPEVNQEHSTALEPKNQILAAALDGGDAFSLELGRDLQRIMWTGEAEVVDLDMVEAAPDELRLEPDADRLDLRQLGHALPDGLEDDRPQRRRLGGEDDVRLHLAGGPVGSILVADVKLGE